MTIRAKFHVTSIEMFSQPADSGTVKLTAGNDKEGDNIDWSKWTPSGSVQMMITNPAAFQFFKDAMQAGKRIYVDFNVVE
jgi:hypothetical protein